MESDLIHQKEIQRPLIIQKRIDALAIGFALVLTLLIAFVSSLIIAIIVAMFYSRGTPEGVDDSIAGGMVMMSAFFLSVICLSPLWLWLSFYLRRVINWPKGAFERTNKVFE